ncbi:MAG: FecR domain-containing protein [Proteobacteria bacterium]|nr:FecR domain-containing protein [Pseudomonadota bacterium]
MSTSAISDRELAAMTVSEAAAYWFVRRDSASMAADDELRFREWLGASATNRSAYEQTESMWSGFVDAADEGELRALRVAALAATRAPRIWPRAVALAATVLLSIALAAFIGYRVSQPHSSGSIATSTSRYATAHNQRSTITLSDGTVVSMNLDTVLDADFASGRRLVHLVRGQAYFDVAKDEARPFIVAAGDEQIQALGTQFDVRLESNRIEVVLVEGRVRVDPGAGTATDTKSLQRRPLEMIPGQRMVVTPGAAAKLTNTNAVKATSWREGWITFEDETLENAIAELNRYSEQPLVAEGEDLKRLRLSGVFRIGQPERFGTLIGEILPVAVVQVPGGETRLIANSGHKMERRP